MPKPRILILGGGFGGAYAVQALSKLLKPDEAEVVLLDRNNYVLFYPLLVEAGVGSIEARHVVVPVRKFIGWCDFRLAEVQAVDLAKRTVAFKVLGGDHEGQLEFDHLILAIGSVTRTPDIPGLKEFGFQLKSLLDAIALRDRAIRLLELANTLQDSEMRKELLTCVVVGANFTGIEFAGEYHAFLHEAAKSYSNVQTQEIRMIVLEYADRILGATGEKLASWCSRVLTARGVEIHVNSTLSEVGPEYAVTARGERIRTHTVLWAAGIAPHPLLDQIEGLPRNKQGYIECEPDLSVRGQNGIWSVGDLASVTMGNGKPYPATAQTASRQGPHAAKNIVAKLRSQPTRAFKYKPLGSFAAIGKKQAAADLMGFPVSGFLGWVLYRATYLAKMPSLGMKLRLMADWTTELVFRNEPVQLGVHRTSEDRL